jgi:hypothetical protein
MFGMFSRPQFDVCKNIFALGATFPAVQIKHVGKIQHLLFAAKCILFKDKLLGDQIKLGSARTGPENVWSKRVSTRFRAFFEPFATPSGNGRDLRTAVVPWAVLATCHVKPTLTLARGSEVKQEFRRKKSSRRR